jgi:hypothetical protein
MKIKVSEATPTQIDWLVVVAMLSGRYSVSDLAPYSTSWAHGGPIIEREIYSFSSDDNSTTKYAWHKDNKTRAYGDTFLIAAMRCYVASKMGDEVEIPEELK